MISVFASDEDALAQKPTNITLKAMPGKAILWFLPYRRNTGALEIPEAFQPESVEAVVVHDNTGYGLATGTRVGVSRTQGDGTYFEICGTRFCSIKAEGLLLIDTAASPQYAA